MIINYILNTGLKIPYSKVKFKKRSKYYGDFKFTKNDIKCVELKCEDCGKIYTNRFEYDHKKTPLCKECKIKKTSLEKYGVNHYNKTREKIEKCKKTTFNNFGSENYFQSDQSKNKMIEKIGVDNPFKSKEIRRKIEQSYINKYGVNNPFKSEKIKEKIKKTNLKKYGFEHPSQNFEIQSRQVSTYLKNKYLKYKEGYFNCVPLFELKDYSGHDLYKWKCLDCETEFEDDFDHGRGPKCPNCFPLNLVKCQKEIIDLLAENHISYEINSRKIIPPLELDIYIPEFKLAIECDGLYWHSNKTGTDKDYHLNKTNACEEKGVQLIHIFEDEYIHKKNIVISRLKNILGLNSNRIGARQTLIKEINSKTKNNFLDTYHIQGSDKSSIKLGAYYYDKLIGVMTFSKPRLSLGQKKQSKDIYELSRFATIADTYTPGLASKMFKYFINEYDPTEVYSYADRRWSQGHLYEKIGFKENKFTGINYWYVRGTKREHRFKYRKNRLTEFKNYSDEKTEQQIMSENSIYRIYDCGNWKFTWRKNEIYKN